MLRRRDRRAANATLPCTERSLFQIIRLGCGSQGETIEEAVRMTKTAIEGLLAYLGEKGQEIPQERDVLVKVSVAA